MKDAGRQWLLRVENSLLTKPGMIKAEGVNQVFIKRQEGYIILIVAKLIDEFLFAGSTSDIKTFF